MENHNTPCKPIKTITKTLSLLDSTVAGTYPQTLDFGKEFKTAVGYYAILTKAAGLTASTLKLGLSDSARTIIDPTCIEHFQVSTAVPIEDRFYKKDPINLDGGKLTVNLVTGQTLAGAFEIQFIAQLERDQQ